VREASPTPRPGASAAAAGLFARVRWLFLLLGPVTMAVLVVLTVAGAGAAGWPLRVAAVAGLAALAYLLGDVLRRNRRAIARERLLSRVGSELLRAADPAAIHHAAVGAALRLLGRDERARASVVDGDLVVTSDRPVPAEVRDALESLRAQMALALDRAALTAELARRASVDPLTGLANRALFHERLGQALARAAADGSTCALLLLDLDDFKTVNDSLGHLRGDHVLVAVAERLRARLRAGDTAARLGGDEFAVLLERGGGEREALAVADRLASDLGQPVGVAGRQVYARASVGVRLAAGGGDPDELLRDADLAMYAAKTSAPGTARLFDATMHERAVQRLDFEAALRRAVLEQQFTVRYQPVVELAGGDVVGMEALVRWDHPLRGLVMPGEFVGLAEESGLIVPIGRWVLHAACQAVRDWQRRFPLERPLFMSVNLSVRQLQQPDLVEDVAGAVDAAGLDPSDLMLEVTESVLVLDDEATIQRLRELRALGVHLAVDDFGTGYSSLAYLRRLPVDTLKLAKPFVDGLTVGPEEAALAHAIVRLADTLRLRVVAEGIEQEAQAVDLRAVGCPYGQGYWFARPMDQFAVEALLAAEQQRRPAARAAQRAAASPTGRGVTLADGGGLRQAVSGDLEEPCWPRSPDWACRRPRA
jgi:diguanylate cyclase (GGDEF)-like protein